MGRKSTRPGTTKATKRQKARGNRAFCALLETHYLFKERHRVDGRRILAHLEMHLRRLGVAAHAGSGERLSALDLLAARYAERIGVAVDGDRAVIVTNQNGVAELLQAIAGVDHDAV